jgi:hypothetical protein
MSFFQSRFFNARNAEVSLWTTPMQRCAHHRSAPCQKGQGRRPVGSNSWPARSSWRPLPPPATPARLGCPDRTAITTSVPPVPTPHALTADRSAPGRWSKGQTPFHRVVHADAVNGSRNGHRPTPSIHHLPPLRTALHPVPQPAPSHCPHHLSTA